MNSLQNVLAKTKILVEPQLQDPKLRNFFKL